MKRTMLAPLALFGALAFHQTSWAQVVGDSACPKHEVDVAAYATCEGDRVARPRARLDPRSAYDMKQIAGRMVLMVDVRSHVEVARTGSGAGVDFVVPYLVAEQPDPQFANRVRAAAARLGGDELMPVLLLCADGELAAAAAEALRADGFEHVAAIDGGFEGSNDGGGWRSAGLPVSISPES